MTDAHAITTVRRLMLAKQALGEWPNEDENRLIAAGFMPASVEIAARERWDA